MPLLERINRTLPRLDKVSTVLIDRARIANIYVGGNIQFLVRAHDISTYVEKPLSAPSAH